MASQIPVNKEQIAEFCRRNHIRRLSLFGSVLRADFNTQSDVDVLVEFEPEHVPGVGRDLTHGARVIEFVRRE